VVGSLMVGAEEGEGRARLEGAGVAAATARREGAGTEAFRMEMGMGLRFGVGVAAGAFWVFREFSVESCRRFLAGLVRIVIRGGEGAWRVDGKGVFWMEGSERVLAGLTRIVMRGGDAWQIHDGWVPWAVGVERVRALSGLARIVMRGGDLHTDEGFGLTRPGKGLLVLFVTVLNTPSPRSVA